MLAYVLALVIGLGSLALYLAAFFFPEVHRKEDFIWSGVGLFYALVIWVCAGRITGGVLLGQTASVALLGWFGWQTLTLRRELTSPEQRTPISPQVQEKLKDFSLTGLGQQLQKQMTSLLKKKQPETQTSKTSPAAVTIAKVNKTASAEPTATLETTTIGATEITDGAPTVETTADTDDSSNIVTIIDSRNTPTETAPTEAAATEAISPVGQPEAIAQSATPEAIAPLEQPEAIAPSATPEAIARLEQPEAIAPLGQREVIASETQVDELGADNAEVSDSPELIPPNPPDPQLVEAAQQSAASDTPESIADATPIEEIAPEVELAPPAEPPGDGDPTMRQNPPDVDIAIEGVPINPEHPPKLS